MRTFTRLLPEFAPTTSHLPRTQPPLDSWQLTLVLPADCGRVGASPPGSTAEEASKQRAALAGFRRRRTASRGTLHTGGVTHFTNRGPRLRRQSEVWTVSVLSAPGTRCGRCSGGSLLWACLLDSTPGRRRSSQMPPGRLVCSPPADETAVSAPAWPPIDRHPSMRRFEQRARRCKACVGTE
jgi:hypothetical protein